MLFTFYCPPSKPLIIEDIDKLGIDDQLEIVKIDNIDNQQKRKQFTKSLFDKLPDLQQSAHKRIRFKSILSKYHKSYQEIQSIAVEKLDAKQLPLNLFIYLTQQLQITPQDQKERDKLQKEKKTAENQMRFVYYVLKYCTDSEQEFKGEHLYKFWSEVTNNGQKTGGFGLKFVKKVVQKYGLKLGNYAKAKNKVGVWFTDNVLKSKKLTEKSQAAAPKSTETKPDSAASTQTAEEKAKADEIEQRRREMV